MRAAAVWSLLFFAAAAQGQVTPEVTCWREDTSTGRTTIVFGYTNAGVPATVPSGAQNFVTPGPDAQSQPVLFASGQVPNAFTMSVATANESSASWSVNGSVAFFNRALHAPCAGSMCLCPAGPDGGVGPDGARGPVGSIGLAGEKGAEGPAGVTGAAGTRGPEGAPGPQGVEGARGPRGETGAQGPAGVTGAAGAVGAKGSIGDPGAPGATGPQGPQGAAGAAGPAGAPGGRGAAGAMGPMGSRGLRGEPGPAGAPGPRGLDGAAGFSGAAGADGWTGAEGEPGPNGAPAIPVIAATIDGERIAVDRPSRLIVMATVTARATPSGSLQLLVAGVRTASFPVSARSITIPIVATIDVDAGEHFVRFAAIEAEVLSSSITVLVTDRPEEPRRRTAAH